MKAYERLKMIKGTRENRNEDKIDFFLTGLKNPDALIEIFHGTHVAVTLKPRRCRPRLLGLLLTNVNYLYSNSRPTFAGRLQVLFNEQRLLFQRNPRLYFSEFLFCYLITVPRNLLNGEQFEIRTQGDDSHFWISRSVINLNFKSPNFGHEIERSRVRDSRNFGGFVWLLDRQSRFRSPLSYSLLNIKELETITTKSDAQTLEIHKLRDAQVVGGEFSIHKRRAFTTQARSSLEHVSWPTEKIFQLEKDKFVYCFGKTGIAPKNSDFVFAGSNPNWFHFLIEILPLILGLGPKTYLGKTIVLSCGQPKQILEVCYSITGKEPLLINHGDAIHFSEVTCISDNRFGYSFDAFERRDDIGLVAQTLNEFFPLYSTNTPKRFVVKRPNSSFRKCGNIEDVYALLVDLGFSVIQTEMLSAQEQFDLFRNAEFVVAESGAALTNAILLPSSAHVLEIQPPGSETDFWPEYFQLFDFSYSVLKGHITVIPQKSFLGKSDFKVDLKELIQRVQYL